MSAGFGEGAPRRLGPPLNTPLVTEVTGGRGVNWGSTVTAMHKP